ncbi:MAG: hypothetical protein E6G45_08835 [Actinobacteria bacterium]|nr:MAG: hypothetical protein E6G45_08835 [Actinomycetota bacterium]
MALQRIDPKAMRRVWKRRRQNERRAQKMENAIRRGLYLRPLAELVGRIAEAAGRVLSRK